MKRTLSIIMFLMIAMSLFVFAAPGVSAAQKKIITVGDSITWGSCSDNTLGGRDLSRTYQGYLRSYAAGSYIIEDYGVSGLSVLPDPYYATVPSERDKARGAYYNSNVQKALKSSPDIVLIMLGTNDSKLTADGKAGVWDSATGGEENFYQAYKKLVKAFIDLPSKPKVYVMLPPPALPQNYRGRNAYRISNEIQDRHIIPIEWNVAEELGLEIIDVRSVFPSPTDQNAMSKLALFLHDCVHPNSRGYQMIAQTVAKHLGISTTPPASGNTNTTPPTSQNNTGTTQQTTPSTNHSGNQNTSPQPPPTPQAPTTPVPATYSVTYNANGASGNIPVDEIKYTTNSQAVISDQGKLTKKGYKFLGWSTDPNATAAEYKAKAKVTIENENLTLYAVWKRVYSITFITSDENILKEVPQKISNIYANRIIWLPNDEDLDYDRDEYRFLGWSSTKDGKKLYNKSVKIKNGSLKLYAIFEEIPEIVEPETPAEEKQEETTPEPPKTPVETAPQETQPDTSRQHDWILPVVLLFIAATVIVVLFAIRRAKRTGNNHESH